jgi:hypothetical protein
MFAMTRPRMLVAVIVGVAFAALLAFAVFSAAASAKKEEPITSENHSWNNYHWARTANPFTLKLGDNLSAAWKPYLQTTSSDWSQSTALDTTIVSGQSNRKCSATLGQVEVCNRTYGQNGWLGIAQIWVSGSHITQGAAKVNDTYYNTSTYNKPEWRNMVMCQEVAHDFGLDHQDENQTNTNLGSCMDYTGNPLGPPSNEHPNQHDYDQVTTIYTHLDSTTTIGASAASKRTSAANEDDDLNSPRGWGQLKQKSADGRHELWERNLGGKDGKDKLITHVIRALEKDK